MDKENQPGAYMCQSTLRGKSLALLLCDNESSIFAFLGFLSGRTGLKFDGLSRTLRELQYAIPKLIGNSDTTSRKTIPPKLFPLWEEILS